ncbi:hypothetical protein GZH46_02684, partial [Fragariocoptes setiger]
ILIFEKPTLQRLLKEHLIKISSSDCNELVHGVGKHAVSIPVDITIEHTGKCSDHIFTPFDTIRKLEETSIRLVINKIRILNAIASISKSKPDSICAKTKLPLDKAIIEWICIRGDECASPIDTKAKSFEISLSLGWESAGFRIPAMKPPTHMSTAGEDEPREEGNAKSIGRRRDPVWEHFVDAGPAATRPHRKAKCKFCGLIFNRSRAHKMRVHIAYGCPISGPEIKAQYVAALEEDGRPVKKPRMQVYVDGADPSTVGGDKTLDCDTSVSPSKTPIVSSGNLAPKSTRKTENDAHLLRMIHNCNLPYKILEKPSFLELLNSLNCKYLIPNHSALVGTILGREYAVSKNRMAEAINQAPSKSITVQAVTWSRGPNQDTVGIMIWSPLVTGDDVFLHTNIDPQRHKYDPANLRGLIESVLKKIGPDKISAFLFDGSHLIEECRVDLQRAMPSIIYIRCVGSLLRSIFQDVMKEGWCEQTVNRTVKLVQAIFSNPKARALVNRNSKRLGNPALKGYNRSRWTTCILMLKSVSANEPTIRQLSAETEFLSSKISNIIVSERYWKDLRALLTMIDPLLEVSRNVEGHSIAICDTFYHLLRLASMLLPKANVADSRSIANALNRASESFLKRFFELDIELYMAGYFVNPKYSLTAIKPKAFNGILKRMLAVGISSAFTFQASLNLKNQVQKYKEESPENFQHMNENEIYAWWQEQPAGNFEIQNVAIRLLNVKPSCVGVYRYFDLMEKAWKRPEARHDPELMERVIAIQLNYVKAQRSKKVKAGRIIHRDVEPSSDLEDDSDLEIEYSHRSGLRLGAENGLAQDLGDDSDDELLETKVRNARAGIVDQSIINNYKRFHDYFDLSQLSEYLEVTPEVRMEPPEISTVQIDNQFSVDDVLNHAD